MAQSFWSKRKNTMDAAGGYIKATDAVSRPTAAVMTLLGIVVVGGLLFAVFSGARWGFAKLAGDDSTPKTTKVVTTNSSNNSQDSDTNGTQSTSTTTAPSVTATSSTSTTTPSTTATSTIPATTSNLPRTGPASNTAVFLGALVISYLLYRKKLLKNQ